MADELSFLSGGDVVEPVIAPEAAPAADVAPAVEAQVDSAPAPIEQPRAPDGKFVAKEPDAPAPAAAPAATIPAAPPEPGHVPITALMDERDKRQALERENAELRAKTKPSEPVTPRAVPDVLEDPKGFQGEMDRRIAETAFETARNFSWRFAVKEHGADTMATVKDWAAQKAGADPHFNLQLLQSDDLYETAVTAWKQEQLLTKVKGVDPAEFDAFLAWKAGQTGAQAPPAIPQAIPPTAPASAALTPPPTPPPASLAAIPSAGGISPVSLDPGEPFEALFNR